MHLHGQFLQTWSHMAMFSIHTEIFCICVVQVYGVYSGVHCDKVQLPQQISAITALVVSVHSSLSSSSGRRTSMNSYLSSERIGRRLSDVSLGSTDKLSSGRDTRLSSSNNTCLAKREVTFSPIHEHMEEDSDTEMKEILQLQ